MSGGLLARGLAKRYGPDVLFRDLDIAVAPGQVLLLRGPNGSGKTQLLRSLAGLVPLDAGFVESSRAASSFWGAVCFREEAPHRRDRRLRYVPAVPAGAGDLSIGEAAFVAARRLAGWGFLSRRRAVRSWFEASRRELEAAVGRELDLDRPARELSFGQQKRLLLGATLLAEDLPAALLLDEPLSGLDEPAVEATIQLLQATRRRGIALLIAEHRSAIEQIESDGEIEMPYLGRRAGQPDEPVPVGDGPRDGVEPSAPPAHASAPSAGPPRLELTDVVAGYPGAEVRCARLCLAPGDIVVLAGTNGAGKTGFVRALLGSPPTTLRGSVRLDGVELADLRAEQSTGRVRYMSQDRRSFPGLKVEEALAVAGRRTGGPADGEDADSVLRELAATRVEHLSSGQRALLCLGQAVASRPRLLVLDEPFANVDATNRERMETLILAFVRSTRAAALIIEHESRSFQGAGTLRASVGDGVLAASSRG